MESIATPEFWEMYHQLPKHVRLLAVKAYRLWVENHYHPSLHFKKLQGYDTVYAVRISRSWRAVGVVEQGTIYWQWIGSHAEYDELFG